MFAPKENLTTEILRYFIAAASVVTFVGLWIMIGAGMMAGRYMDIFCLFPATMVSSWSVQRVWDFYYERYLAKYNENDS